MAVASVATYTLSKDVGRILGPNPVLMEISQARPHTQVVKVVEEYIRTCSRARFYDRCISN